MTDNKRDITNGLVNEIKSKLEKFKQNKKNENSNKNTDELNIDITKDMLDKYKKSK